MKKLIVKQPFILMQEELPKLDDVDMITGGMSPGTVRFLTKGNKYINIGLNEIDKDSCEVVANNNSYEVKDSELVEAHASFTKYFKTFKPDV